MYIRSPFIGSPGRRNVKFPTAATAEPLAEASTKDISQAVQPKDFKASKKVAAQGGNVAKVAMKELEAKTGKKVVTALNAKKHLNTIRKD